MVWHIIGLGLNTAALARHSEVHWLDDIRPDADAVLLPADIGPDLWHSAAQQLHPLVPLISLGLPAFVTLTPDAVCDGTGPQPLDAALARLAPVRNRIEALADLPLRHHPDSARFAVLALSHTRNAAIEAARRPGVSSTVVYPLLHNRPGILPDDLRSSLETLAGFELLERRFAARVLACPACNSGRMAAREECVSCRSADLQEETILHHYRCGFQDRESLFLQGNELICPKCRRELRHFGVDYGRPGLMVRCRSCQQVMTEPQAGFFCLDCGAQPRGEEAQTRDWFHYTLTGRGIAVLNSGELPRLDMQLLSRQFPRTHPWKDFALLVREQLRVALRYRRPFSVGLIEIANLADLRRQRGTGGADEALRLLSHIIVENLRDTDFVTAPRGDTLAVAMPETAAVQAETVFGRIATAAKEKLSHPLDLRFQAAEGEGAGILINSLGAETSQQATASP